VNESAESLTDRGVAQRLAAGSQPALTPAKRAAIVAGAMVLGGGGMLAILLISAGRADVPQFWALSGWIAAAMAFTTSSIDAGLLRERLRPGGPGRDGGVIQVLKLLILAHLIIAGIDVGRTHWSPRMPQALIATGFALLVLGYALSIWAMLTNRFFSPIVRLQTERGHHLVQTGPYRFIRHPGYAGALLAMLGSPLALGSAWSAAPIVGLALLIRRRAALEDRFLHEQLAGYREYAARVRARLIPGVW
jgi:protein-S-isoprenylcysteine O-methyltransferase Ste14